MPALSVPTNTGVSTTSQLPPRWIRRGEAFVQQVPAGYYVIGLRQGNGYFRLHDGSRNSVQFVDLASAERLVAKINASTHITSKYWV